MEKLKLANTNITLLVEELISKQRSECQGYCPVSYMGRVSGFSYECDSNCSECRKQYFKQKTQNLLNAYIVK